MEKMEKKKEKKKKRKLDCENKLVGWLDGWAVGWMCVGNKLRCFSATEKQEFLSFFSAHFQGGGWMVVVSVNSIKG